MIKYNILYMDITQIFLLLLIITTLLRNMFDIVKMYNILKNLLSSNVFDDNLIVNLRLFPITNILKF